MVLSPSQVYHQLLEHYGPQDWWPLLHNQRGTLGAQFEIAVGAILTQNTSWSNVLLVLPTLAEAGLLEPAALAAVERKTLSELIRPAGSFNQKARYLQNFAAFLSQHPFDDLSNQSGPSARLKLLQVTGVGPETADCILLYALGHRVFVVDAYTRRIFFALGYKEATQGYTAFSNWISAQLKPEINLLQEFHALMVAHGKTNYSKKPYPMLDPVLRSR